HYGQEDGGSDHDKWLIASVGNHSDASIDAGKPGGIKSVMASLTLELPSQKSQTAFNLRRWQEVLADQSLADLDGRIETNRHGHILMSPPPSASHGSFQSEISYFLRTLLEGGRVLTECPISTADGVKAADVAWASRQRLRELGERVCFLKAPEICVEVLSPANSEAE